LKDNKIESRLLNNILCFLHFYFSKIDATFSTVSATSFSVALFLAYLMIYGVPSAANTTWSYESKWGTHCLIMPETIKLRIQDGAWWTIYTSWGLSHTSLSPDHSHRG